MAPKRSNDNKVKKGRGRPAGSRKSKAVSKPVPKPRPKQAAAAAAKKKIKPRRKEIQEETEDELSLADAAPLQARKPRKHEADAIAEPEPKLRKQYVQLEARTKRITQEQIDTWPQVSAQVLEQITTVIHNAKKDIAETQRDERRIVTAHNTLNPLVRRLARQLAVSRIPPQAKDIHFNIDKLTERNAQVSRQVTTGRHAKQLLSEQANVAQHLLQKDEENLEELKRNAKKWRTEWKHQKKHGRLHPLLDDDDKGMSMMDGDGPDDIGLKPSEPVDASRLDAADNHVAPVLEQVRRSLENMQGNHAQVEGLATAMGDARAGLDEVLFRHANAAQYAAF